MGANAGRIQLQFAIEARVRVTVQRSPVRLGGIPLLASGSQRATFEVAGGGVIEGDHGAPGTRFDGEIAEGHARFHAHRRNRFTGELDGVAGRAGGADHANECQRQVFG